MKKMLIPVALMFMMAACGGGSDKPAESDAPAPSSMVDEPATDAAGDNSSNPDYVKGLDLVKSNDCLTCHTEKQKIVGPTYHDVAQKYAGADDAQIDQLAKKIIDGGVGVWGEVPMTPHPTVSMEDARQMVKYVLLVQ